jgi:riboflavin-specific deaminase-like protein
VEFRQLLPQPATVTVEELLAALEPAGSVPEHRPYVRVNFISSIDGRATFQGRSGQLGDEGDRSLFHGLREHADAVLAGTSTLRVEGYGRMLGKPERRQRRTEAGRSPEPLACIVSRSGALPLEIPLFSEPEARVVIFTAAQLELNDVAAQAEVVRLQPEELRPANVLQLLHRDYDVSTLLCEGGPSLFGSLLREGVVDELCLSLAPKLAGGGSSPTITTGPELPELVGLKPVWMLERAGTLFLRYAVSS